MLAKKKNAEKDNMIKIITQTTKKIDYMKQFRVRRFSFRQEKVSIFRFWNA